MSITYLVQDEKRTMMNELQTPFTSTNTNAVSSGKQDQTFQSVTGNVQGQQHQTFQNQPSRTYNVQAGTNGLDEHVPDAHLVHPTVATPEPLTLVDAYLLHIVLGFFGVLHFRMGRYTMGILYLITVGGLGLGYLVDLWRMPQLVAEYNTCQKLGQKFQGNESPKTIMWDCYALWVTGIIGGYHFYLGRCTWGIYYACTAGGFGTGWLVDLFRMPALSRGLPTTYMVSDCYILWFSPLGFMGAHYLYLQKTKTFLLYFFTFGIFGLGWLVDSVRIPGLVKEANRHHEQGVDRHADNNIPTATLAA
jgi:TM2 domain-containing membrane protein YozV